jgi:hypothetical protein
MTVFALAFVGLTAITGPTEQAKADATSPYASYFQQTVWFCGNHWDVAGVKDGSYSVGASSVSVTDGTNAIDHTAMLLLHDEKGGTEEGTNYQAGKQQITPTAGIFEGADTIGTNKYEGSNLKANMEAQSAKCLANLGGSWEGSGVKTTTLLASGINTMSTNIGKIYSTNEDTKEHGLTGQYFFPLSYREAAAITGCDCTRDPDGIRAFSYFWWLRTPGLWSDYAAMAYNDGEMTYYGGPVDSRGAELVARPALQIDLDSFAPFGVGAGSQITLANRKWDVIGAGTQPFVTPVSDYTPLPTMGDPDTLTLLYDKDNVGSGADQDTVASLQTSFNASGGGNAYKNSLLQSKMTAIYNDWTNWKGSTNAKTQVVNRSLPTQTTANATGAEAYDNVGGTTIPANLWPLSATEATAITSGLREFSTYWWLRSPGSFADRASYVNGGGSIYSEGSYLGVSYPDFLARPALQIISDSGLLSSRITGLTLAGDSTVSTGGTVTITPTVQGGTSPLTWTYSGNGITSLTNGVVVASSVSEVKTAEICAETALGEFKRCKTLKVLPKGDTPDLDLDYTNETITGFEASTSYEYCVDTANTCTPSTAYTPGAVAKPITDFGAISNSDTKYLRIVKSQIEDVSVDSDVETVTIPPRPTAPAVSAASGTISGLTTNMEYNTTGVSFAGSWTAIAGTTLSGVAEGTYYIRDKAVDGISGHFVSNVATVALTIPVTGVNIAPTSPSITYGQTVQLAETVLPSDTPVQTVNWSSSDTNVATVNSSGLVTSVSAGDVTITAKSTVDQSKYGTTSVTVSKKPLTVSIGSIVIPDRPYIAGTITAPVTGVVTIDSGIVNSDAITVSSCRGDFANDTVAASKPVDLTCSLTGPKASSYTITTYPAAQGTILDYTEIDLGGHELEVPTDAAVTPESSPGAGDGYITLPTTDPEYEVIVDDVTVIVPGGSVIKQDGTIVVPSTSPQLVSFPPVPSVEVPGNSVVNPDAGTITVPAGSVTVNGETVAVPAGSVVNPATGDITLPNGKVAVTQTKGSERLTLSSATITQGKTLTISGSGFTPNELVRLELHTPTQVLSASVTVNTSGKFTLTKAVTTATAVGNYQVVAYDNTSNIQLKSANLKVVKPASTKPGPVSAKAKKAKGSITFIWGSSGFLTTVEIYYRVKGNSKWKVVRVSGADRKKIKLKRKKTYQFQLRSYKSVSGKNYYSTWTKKTVKL